VAECWQDNLENWTGSQIGDWAYEAGNQVGAGAITLTGTGNMVQGIRIRADAAATFNIDGGDTVTLKNREVWVLNPNGRLEDPTINVVTGTIEYFIEFLS
jgi:hypothetical protein